MTYPDFVTIYEVGPRDGLQNEAGGSGHKEQKTKGVLRGMK